MPFIKIAGIPPKYGQEKLDEIDEKLCVVCVSIPELGIKLDETEVFFLTEIRNKPRNTILIEVILFQGEKRVVGALKTLSSQCVLTMRGFFKAAGIDCLVVPTEREYASFSGRIQTTNPNARICDICDFGMIKINSRTEQCTNCGQAMLINLV